MTKWEYHQDRGFGPMTDNRMNALGREGWELISITVIKEAFGHAVVHIFKRPIIEKSK